jgi:hypothetical protein
MTLVRGLVLAVLVAALFGAAPAAADFNARFQNAATNACLGWGGGERIYGTDCKYTVNVSWSVREWRDHTLRLRSVDGGGCLDDSRFGLRAFQPCWEGASSLSRYQSWYRVAVAGAPAGYFAYRNQATRRCLDDSPLGVRSIPCNGLRFQWYAEAR